MNNFLKLRFLDVILIIILHFVAGAISSILYLPIFLLKKDPYILAPAVAVGNYVILFFIIYLLFLKPRNQVFRVSYSCKGFVLFPVVLFLFAGQFIITEYLTALIPTTGPWFGKLYQAMNKGLVGNFDKFPINTFLLIVVIAPIFEEIFFRGFILKGMLNNNIKPVYAVIISAAIFGGVHVFPWQVVGGIFAGLVLGLTYYKTGSLLTCTLLHFLNNLLGYILYLKYGSLETPDYEVNQEILVLAAVGVVLFFSYIYLRFTKNNQWKFN